MNNVLRWGIFFIAFCLPLHLVRFSIFGIPTTVLELMIHALFLIWLANKGYKNLWVIIKKEKLLIWGIVLLMVGVSAATIFSWNIRTSAGIWKAWFFDPILFFMVLVSVIRKKDIKLVLNALIFSGIVVAIISLVYLIQGNLYQGRLQGVFNSPNFLAMYLAIPLIFSLYLMRPGLRRVFSIIIFLLLASVIFFTKSFGALLGILGALFFGLLLYFYVKNKKAIVLAIVFLFFGAVLIFGLLKINSSTGLKSFDARFVIWQKAWDVFKDSPVLGIGPGTFENYFPPYPKWGVPQPHNIFLAFLIQTGIVGFIGFITLLIWFFQPEAGRPRADRLRLLLIMLMVYILIHGLVDTTYWKNDLSLVFWLIMGLMLIIKKESNPILSNKAGHRLYL